MTSTHGTWTESVEVIDITDNSPMDWGSIIEVILYLRWQQSGSASLGYNEMRLKYTNGDITLPAPGIIEWRAEASRMGTMVPGLYEMILTLQDSTDTVPLILGSVSIVG